MLRAWLNRIFTRRARPAAARRPGPARRPVALGVEGLERRELLSATMSIMPVMGPLPAAGLVTTQPISHAVATAGNNHTMISFNPTQYFVHNGAPAWSDPIQGTSGSCFLVATLSSLASTSWGRSKLEADLRYVGNYNYQVTLYQNIDVRRMAVLAPITVTVSYNGTWNEQTDCDESHPAQTGFWATLYLRAWEKEFNHGNPPAEGDAHLAMEQFSGQFDNSWSIGGNSRYALTPASLAAALSTGHPVTAWTCAYQAKPQINTTGLVASHVYSVLGIDARGNVTLRNPWGRDWGSVDPHNPTHGLPSTKPPQGADDGVITIPWSEFSKYFNGAAVGAYI
jgi:hypothetical protein